MANLNPSVMTCEVVQLFIGEKKIWTGLTVWCLLTSSVLFFKHIYCVISLLCSEIDRERDREREMGLREGEEISVPPSETSQTGRGQHFG